MSATPIPRTLEMAVTGIRELSTLATPPEERLPILTYVGPARGRARSSPRFAASSSATARSFYIHNMVATVDSAAARDSVTWSPRRGSASPTARWREHELERVIVDYYEKRSDVLVCTTIVETGLDIPNANTLIVETGRRLRAEPAPPAARPGGQGAGARLRVLPLPAPDRT